jgi:hypothetical protein
MPERLARYACASYVTQGRGHIWSRGETFGVFLFPLIAALVLTGCGMTQLQGRTIEIGGSVGSIYTSQVLANLHRLAEDRQVVPSLFVVMKGNIHTVNSITPGVSIPLGNQVTRTVAVGGVSQIVGSYNAFTLQGQEVWDQSWDIEPKQNTVALRQLRALYLYVLGRLCGPSVTNEKCRKQVEQDLRPDANDPLVTAILDECQRASDRSACFRVRPKGEDCVQPSASYFGDQQWVCLGKYQDIQEKLTFDHEMIISGTAFQRDVLFNLVLYSLKVQSQENGKPKTAK